MTESTRITVLDFILKRQAFTDDITDYDHIGIQKLLSDGVYDFAYPLHNGSMEITESCRYKLNTEWAEMRNIVRLEIMFQCPVQPMLTISFYVMQEPAIRLYQGVFWCSNSYIFRLVGILHLHADSSFYIWRNMFLLRYICISHRRN